MKYLSLIGINKYSVCLGTYPVSGDNPQLGSVLQEDIARGLLRTDSDTIVSDDCTRGWLNLELLSGEFKYGSEWSRLGHTQSAREDNESVKEQVIFRGRGTYTLKGSFGSEVRVILKVTFDAL